METENYYSWVEENQYVGASKMGIKSAIEEAVGCWFNDDCDTTTAVTANQRRNVSPSERRNRNSYNYIVKGAKCEESIVSGTWTM